MNILVTGGCGFIGSNFARYLREKHPEDAVAVFDKLTYAGATSRLSDLGVMTIVGDVCEPESLLRTLRSAPFDAVCHLAAETHVDRSIDGSVLFAQTNCVGTAVVLEEARRAGIARILHISTDEVYGDAAELQQSCSEEAPHRPSSPYAASKSYGDLIALACHRTHGLPVVVARPSNCYGPRQHGEKFIPTAIRAALAGEAVPVYGDGRQVREWLHVSDCCRALDLLLREGRPGQAYNVGPGSARSNLDVARRIVEVVGRGRIEHVADRPGHDRRYAVSGDKIARLGWRPQTRFEDGLAETVRWYAERARGES